MEIRIDNPNKELAKKIELYNKSLKKISACVTDLEEANTLMEGLRQQLVGINNTSKEVEDKIQLLKANIASVVKIVNENNNALKKVSQSSEEGKRVIQQLESRNMSAYEHYYNYSIELEEAREWLKKAKNDAQMISIIEIPKAKQSQENQEYKLIEVIQIVKDLAKELQEDYGINVKFDEVDKKVQEKLADPKTPFGIELVEFSQASDEDCK